MKKYMIQCEIYRTGNFTYFLAKHAPGKNNFFFDENKKVHQIKTINDELFIETYTDYNIWFDHDRGYRWIVATNDPALTASHVPTIPNLWDKLEKINVIVQRINWRPEVYGGMSMEGEYRYDLKLELTAHGQVITSF